MTDICPNCGYHVMLTPKRQREQERELERLLRALRVIRTWAAYDDELCEMAALLPGAVVELCDKVLGERR